MLFLVFRNLKNMSCTIKFLLSPHLVHLLFSTENDIQAFVDISLISFHDVLHIIFLF